jgi:nucleoside 2-deoxyribosyltransferase
MFWHAIAILPGDRRKSIVNKTDDEILAHAVIPFVSTGAVRARWGSKTQSYQVLELRIYGTEKPWVKQAGIPLDKFLGKKKNQFAKFEQQAKHTLGIGAHRVFVIMPIQGEKFGTQEQQRIFKEFDERFETIEAALAAHNCVSIRIDKEHPIDNLVSRIKIEIEKAQFIVADLTDERPSCYFEAGYAEALGRSVVYVASKDSVIHPGTPTKIHFDVHMNVHFFTNHVELSEDLEAAFIKNRDALLRSVTPAVPVIG